MMDWLKRKLEIRKLKKLEREKLWEIMRAIYEASQAEREVDEIRARIAKLKGETCRLDETDSYSNANEVIHVLECSECGRTCEHVNGSYPRCPHCGARVKGGRR